VSDRVSGLGFRVSGGIAPQLVAVVGPTASGKTSLAIQLAERLETEIISADSMQFYRGMEIGTGAPSAEELGRVKHHFIGCIEPSEDFSAGAFQETARGVVAGINARGRMAVVVGGSGLYVSALIDGLFEGPGKDEAIRRRLQEEAEELGASKLYAHLQEVDPDYARIINHNDLRRIVRALEVFELTGRPLSALHREHREASGSLDAIQIALDYPRDDLYARINARVDRMIEQGLVDEVRRLLEQGYGPHIERLRSLGYREIAAQLRGECELGAAIEQMKQNTRRYAKRQLTWFRGDPRIQWLRVEEQTTQAVLREGALDLLTRGVNVAT
jgi:tRNA dimethylallyltransferase